MKHNLIISAVFASLLALSALFATDANAWCCYRGGYYYHGGYNSWVAPAVIGGVVGYAIAQPRVYAPPPVVYVQPPVTYVQQPYPAGYVQQTILDANCNCYRTVLVPQQ
jgi:hypothetical protein